MNVLTAEDVEFLRKLGNVLKTQDNCGNAKPLFFTIREELKIGGIDLDYSDGAVLVIGDDHDEFYDLDSAKESISEWYDIPIEDMSEHSSLSDLHDFLDKRGIDNTYTGYNNGEKFHNCFLTKRACEQHIRLNHYHYKRPKPYADTAWRNPEFERLLRIVEKFATVEEDEK